MSISTLLCSSLMLRQICDIRHAKLSTNGVVSIFQYDVVWCNAWLFVSNSFSCSHSKAIFIFRPIHSTLLLPLDPYLLSFTLKSYTTLNLPLLATSLNVHALHLHLLGLDILALRKKRERRVSFVFNKITFVHIFCRDDNSTSSLFEPPSSSDPSVLGFFYDLASHSDDDQQPKPQTHSFTQSAPPPLAAAPPPTMPTDCDYDCGSG
ncbi:hypothetical protein JHK85_043702 [Glycine max]|nr:hypothetical protein JHK85_043702 [Glycine max]